MRTNEIELAAAKNFPFPKHMTMPEICLYLSLRALYSSWRKGDISKIDGVAEKKKVISECKRFDNEYQLWRSVYATYQDNIRKAGTMLSDIEKSKNVEDIALKACEVIGIMTGDGNFAKRQERKIRNEPE